MHRDIAPALLATLLVLAGCSAVPAGLPGAGPGGSGVGADAPVHGGVAADGAEAVGGVGGADGTTAERPTDAGVLDAAPADRPTDIDDFEHLNVTVTEVTFERIDGPSVTFDVDDQTIDLARLHGKNATLVDSSRMPEGVYTGAVIEVDGATGILETGEAVDVRLPGGQLRIEEPFTVEDDAPLEFAFDVTVVAADEDGEYVLAPVVSGPGGTDGSARAADGSLAEVDPTATEREGTAGEPATGDDGDAGADRYGTIGRGGAADRTGGAGSGDSAEATGDVDIEFDGATSPGETLLVTVTRDGAPVSGATVEVGGETRRTNRYGTAAVAVPDDTRVLTVAVEHDGERAKLVREYADRGGPDG